MRKVFFLLLILMNGLIIAACSESEEKEVNEESIVTPVETEQVTTGDFIVEKSTYGHISPMKQIPVMIQQPGEVTSLKVENGDKVKKNDHIGTVKSQMGSTAIYAPADGEIAHLNIQENGFQSNEEPFALIIDLESVQAEFNVTPKTKDQFKIEQKVNVFIDEKKYEAEILTVDTMPNETGQYSVIVEIDNEERYLAPGETAKLMIPEKKLKDTIIVPTDAIMTESDESYVFIVEDDTAKKVNVEIKETQTDKTAVEADLKKETEVIVNGQFTLSDGAKVEVVKEGK